MASRPGDAADMLAAVGRHWGWVLGFGVFSLITQRS